MSKSKILTKYFNIYGYGNFDLRIEEIEMIIEILGQSNLEIMNTELKELYEQLQSSRMG